MMTSKKPCSGFHKTWASVAASEISSANWPFRYYDVNDVKSCEEVITPVCWEKIQQGAQTNRMECLSVWNSVMIKQYREMSGGCYSIGTPHSLGRNLFQQLLAKNFEGPYITHQEISLTPVEIYVAPCHYARYNPCVDLCIVDPYGKGKVCLTFVEGRSKYGVVNGIHRTMFYTLSGDRCSAFCFVIKATMNGKYQIYLGKIEWPKTMLQMLRVCGSDVSRQLGFNHRMHGKGMSASYAYMGEIDVKEDDCPIVPLFLNTIDVLSQESSETFLPLTPQMNEIVEKRKREDKHIPLCIIDDVECCNKQFDIFT